MCGFDLEMFLSNFYFLAQRFTKAPRLNVNSICNTFFAIQKLIKSISDIFLISETKIGDTFPHAKFKIKNYKSFRKDRDAFGG